MPATHKLQLTFDTATSELRAVHRCTVEVGGQFVSHAEPVELGEEVGAAMRGMIEQNAAAMESIAGTLAVRHVAASTGKDEIGVKRLTVAGSLTSKGDAAAK